MPRKATTKREEWAYINLPKELVARVDALVNEQKHGYRSRGDFVADAVRRRLEELKAMAR